MIISRTLNKHVVCILLKSGFQLVRASRSSQYSPVYTWRICLWISDRLKCAQYAENGSGHRDSDNVEAARQPWKWNDRYLGPGLNTPTLASCNCRFDWTVDLPARGGGPRILHLLMYVRSLVRLSRIISRSVLEVIKPPQYLRHDYTHI